MAKKAKQPDFSKIAPSGVLAGTPPASDIDATLEILSEASNNMKVGERVSLVPRRSIIPSQSNKKIYEVDELDAMARDIADRGIQQPLIVRQSPNGMYVIISGHRRFAANEIAMQQYGYDKGDYLPCIVRSDVNDSLSEKEAIILDNLQRAKTDFNRMMEIIEMRGCANERVERGEDIPAIRPWVIKRLGISQSEMTRFEKIYSSLSPELMEKFRAQCFATQVAHFIASTADANIQKYILEHWTWEKEVTEDGETKIVPNVLTFPNLKSLLVEYTATHGLAKNTKDTESEKPVMPKLSSMDDGVVALRGSFNSLAGRVEKLTSLSLKKKDEKALLKKAGKLLQELASFEQLVNELSSGGDESGGDD